MSNRPLKVEHTSRQVINNKVITALSNSDDCVALLVSQEDLSIIIDGLLRLPPLYHRRIAASKMADDFIRLKMKAFG